MIINLKYLKVKKSKELRRQYKYPAETPIEQLAPTKRTAREWYEMSFVHMEYLYENFNVAEIGAVCGVRASAVLDKLARMGIDRNRPNEVRYGKKGKVTYKTCQRCEALRPIDEYFSPGTAVCYYCRNEDRSEDRVNNQKENPEKFNEANRIWQQNNPDKVKVAHFNGNSTLCQRPTITVVSEYAGELMSEVLIKCDGCGEEWTQTLDVNIRCPEGCHDDTISHGANKIDEYLTNAGEDFAKEKRFPDCKSVYPLPFDFAVYVNGSIALIEYDGRQHFEPIEFYGGEERLKGTQERDEIKNAYCRENNIPLLRIPYTVALNDIPGMVKKFINNVSQKVSA